MSQQRTRKQRGIFGLHKIRQRAAERAIKALAADTNEPPAQHLADFLRVRTSVGDSVVLLPCQVNGERTSMICWVQKDTGLAKYEISPMFVAVTPAMDLRDKDGVSPNKDPGGKEPGLSSDGRDHESP